MAKRSTLIDKVGVVSKRASRLLQRKTRLKYHFGWHYKHSPVRGNRILFESFHGKNISDSPLAVLEALIASGKAGDYEIYYSTNDVARDQSFVDSNNLPVKLVDISTPEYACVLATAKYLINNSSFPAYFIRRPNQVYVQTWHGTPWKTLGKRMRFGIESMYNVQHNFLQASCLTFPNEFTRQAIMRDYNLEDLFTGKVALVGYPRNSVFLKERDESLRARLGLEGFETFAYMPTWRGKSNHDVSIKEYRATIEDYFAKLDESLRDDQKLFVNFHSMVASSISIGQYKHIFPFPADVGNYEFLAQMDALITDYSSVFFDFALTRRPIVLFAYDLEEYMQDRGMYFTIDELPFPVVRDIDDLCNWLRDGSYARPVTGFDAFAEKYLSYDVPENADLVLDLLLDKPNVPVKIIDYSRNAERSWRLFCPSQQENLTDIKSMFEFANPETDILVLPRSQFGPSESACVYDNYRDDLNYLFRTSATPRTFAEDIVKGFSPKTKARLRDREHVRLVGDVPITEEFEDYGVVSLGRSHSDGAMKDYAAKIGVYGTTVLIEFASLPGTLEKVFVTRFREVLWERACTADEALAGWVALDVMDLLEDIPLSLKRSNSYVVSMLFKTEDGDLRIANPYDEGHIGASSEISDVFYPSVEVRAEDVDVSSSASVFQIEQSFIGQAKDRSILVTPHYSEYGKLSLLMSYDGDAADFRDAKLTHIATPNQKSVIVRAKMPAGDFSISDVILQNRVEVSPLTHSLPFEAKERNGWIELVIRFKPIDYHFEGAFWDLKIVIREESGRTSSCFVRTSQLFRQASKVLNWQADAGQGNILFPYNARRLRLAFTFRARTKDDAMITRVKEVAAFASFAVLHSYWTRKRVWLVFEKYCSLAQDNGFYFFKYCMDNLPESESKHVYYVIDRSVSDYKNVEPYADHVIDFMSFKHMLYLMVADIYIGSDSKSHLYQWRTKPNVVRGRIMRHKIFFLQHGVTALKRVDMLFGKHGSSPMSYFLTTSEREQAIVMENFDYDPEQAPVLGFSRWDVLEDRRDPDRPVILIMPTWRSWLEDLTDEAFVKSEYYQAYSTFVQSDALQAVLDAYNSVVKFFIHPKLSAHMKSFSSEYGNVELVEMGSRPLNELIMECSLLVTDYSSVCWDVLYMDKPVVYYQFDQQAYRDDIGSYIDFDEELPGKVCVSEDECIRAIEAYAASGFKMTELDEQRSQAFLPVKDKNNRERTYKFLVSRGF